MHHPPAVHIRRITDFWRERTSRHLRNSYGADWSYSDQTEALGLRRRLAPIRDVELVENVGDVGLHRTGSEEERLGDLLIGLSSRYQAQDLHLPLRETGGVTHTRRLCGQTGRQCGGTGECRRRSQRGAQVTDVVQKSRRLRSIALRRVELGDGKKRQRPFEGHLAYVGQVESGGQMGLGVQEITGRGLDLTKEPVGGQANQWLIRFTGERQGFGCTCSRAVAIVRGPVIARPAESTIGPTKDTAAPGEPAIVRCQPGMSARKVARIEA